METILIDITQVFHTQAKHRVSRSIYSSGFDLVPFSSFVNIDVDGSSNFSILLKVLRCSNHYIVPSNKQQPITLLNIQSNTNYDSSRYSTVCVTQPPYPSPLRSSTVTSYPKDDANPSPFRIYSSTKILLVSPPFFSRTTAPLKYALGAPATTVSWPFLVKRFPESRENPKEVHRKTPRKFNSHYQKVAFQNVLFFLVGGNNNDKKFHPCSCLKGHGSGWDSFQFHLLLQMVHRQRSPFPPKCHSFVPGVPHLEERRSEGKEGILKMMWPLKVCCNCMAQIPLH